MNLRTEITLVLGSNFMQLATKRPRKIPTSFFYASGERDGVLKVYCFFVVKNVDYFERIVNLY